MKMMLVTDDSNKNLIGEHLKEGLIHILCENGIRYRHISVKSEYIHNCSGCFNCWTNTPGSCVFDDIGKLISDSYIENQYVIFLSPIKFGCYSTAIKKVLDRITPNNLPFLTKYRNRTRHKARYGKYPKMVTVGYGDDISETEKQTFISLANANAINFQKASAGVYICQYESDIIKTIVQVSEKLMLRSY